MTDTPGTSPDELPTGIAPARASRLLTAAEFHRLADVPPEVEWFANLTNPQTRRAYENAVLDFMRFAGIARPEEFRTVTRAHVIAWRDELTGRGLGGVIAACILVLPRIACWLIVKLRGTPWHGGARSLGGRTSSVSVS